MTIVEKTTPYTKPVVIDGRGNYLFINFIKYFSVIILFALVTIIIIHMVKHQKIKKIFLALAILLFIICILAFFTEIYDEFMRGIFPYYYGV